MKKRKKRCRCGFDWLELRKALGWTQADMCTLLAISDRTLSSAESRTNHRCPMPSVVLLLRIYLQAPELKERLLVAGFPYPWPEDLDESDASAN